eukprot:1003751-Prymnesium_polylepis.1
MVLAQLTSSLTETIWQPWTHVLSHRAAPLPARPGEQWRSHTGRVSHQQQHEHHSFITAV